MLDDLSSSWSTPISHGKVPLVLDLAFERPEDKAWPFRINERDQYFLCPSICGLAPFVLPLPYSYRTDGPSIPWWVQWAVRKDGPLWIPALPHDVACSGELFHVDAVNQIMHAAVDLAPAPVPKWQARKALWAVDKFCWITFRAHKAAHVTADRALILQASRDLWAKHAPLFAGYARLEEVSSAFDSPEFGRTAMRFE